MKVWQQWFWGRGSRLLVKRYYDREGTPAAEFALHVHCSAHFSKSQTRQHLKEEKKNEKERAEDVLCELLADRQAETRATKAPRDSCINLLERLKESRDVCFRNADARIGDGDLKLHLLIG